MKNDTFTAKWILMDDDIYPKKLVTCSYCKLTVGSLEEVEEKGFPRMCPSCKRTMENGNWQSDHNFNHHKKL